MELHLPSNPPPMRWLLSHADTASASASWQAPVLQPAATGELLRGVQAAQLSAILRSAAGGRHIAVGDGTSYGSTCHAATALSAAHIQRVRLLWPETDSEVSLQRHGHATSTASGTFSIGCGRLGFDGSPSGHYAWGPYIFSRACARRCSDARRAATPSALPRHVQPPCAAHARAAPVRTCTACAVVCNLSYA